MLRLPSTRAFFAGFLGPETRRVALVSGGFDPVHSGHVNMILEASQYGEVWVLLNTDEWLTRKKGRPFMDWDERAAVVGSIRGVSRVIRAQDGDGTVSWSLRGLWLDSTFQSPRYETLFTFCNGGDRVEGTTPEQEVCEELGIRMVWGVGGGKTQSSSVLLDRWGLSRSDN